MAIFIVCTIFFFNKNQHAIFNLSLNFSFPVNNNEHGESECGYEHERTKYILFEQTHTN